MHGPATAVLACAADVHLLFAIMTRRLLPILLIIVAAAGLAVAAAALWTHPGQALAKLSGTMPGPFSAEVLQVVDGDTLEVRVAIWLGQDVVTHVRLLGIDTPELRGKCDAEKAKAAAARDLLRSLVEGQPVTLRDVAYDKYGGRVLALVSGADGKPLADRLITAGLARAYDGKARAGWCE